MNNFSTQTYGTDQLDALTQELIAKATLEEYTFPKKAALVTGSIAQGKADLSSDIDLML